MGIPSDQRMILIREAKEIKEQALSFGTEEGSLYFQYDRQRLLMDFDYTQLEGC